jgi:AcrR family transcriptional regulator
MSSTEAPHGASGGRDRILDAAEALFARRGFSATPIKAIAAEAGVATGLLYYHFDSKDHLLETLVDERMPVPRIDEVLEDAGSEGLPATLARIAHAILRVLDEHQDIARILLQDAATRDDDGGRLQRMLRTELDGLATYLRTVTLATQQRAELASRILVTNLFVGVILLPHPDRSQLVQGTVDIVLGALA